MKPRARYSPYGNGYWIVRTRRWDGYVVQGIGNTLESAYWDWVRADQYVGFVA